MYRSTPPARLYVCPRCTTPGTGPAHGGDVTCGQCQTVTTLADHTALCGRHGLPPLPSNDPQRIAQLRPQDGRPRIPSPSLLAVLGGPSIQPGRETEALAIWQNLRMRAAAGDLAAAEDLSLLTLMLAQDPWTTSRGSLADALVESALDALALPRHRQEILGRMCRSAVAAGDRTRAAALLGAMVPDAADLDSDSEYRVSWAILATLDRDGARVLDLLGARRDELPIVDTMDELASVLRANAFELVGDVARAAETLRELQAASSLARVQARFTGLQLCARAGAAYTHEVADAAAKRAATSASRLGNIIGGSLAVTGLVFGACFASSSGRYAIIPLALGALVAAFGVKVIVRARKAGQHAAWLRVHGLSLSARVVGAQRTGVELNDTPLYKLDLQVAGPQGPYAASFQRLAHEHQIALLIQREVRVRANPNALTEILLED